MTKLKVVRRTVDIGGRRALVVTMDDNGGKPLLWFREKGRRTSYALPLAWCYARAAKLAAEALLAERKARRRAERAS